MSRTFMMRSPDGKEQMLVAEEDFARYYAAGARPVNPSDAPADVLAGRRGKASPGVARRSLDELTNQIPLAGNIVGDVAGSFAGPAGSIIGGGVGAASGELLRQGLRAALGFSHPDNFAQSADQALLQGAGGLATSAGGRAAEGAMKAAPRMLMGSALNVDPALVEAFPGVDIPQEALNARVSPGKPQGIRGGAAMAGAKLARATNAEARAAAREPGQVFASDLFGPKIEETTKYLGNAHGAEVANAYHREAQKFLSRFTTSQGGHSFERPIDMRELVTEIKQPKARSVSNLYRNRAHSIVRPDIKPDVNELLNRDIADVAREHLRGTSIGPRTESVRTGMALEQAMIDAEKRPPGKMFDISMKGVRAPGFNTLNSPRFLGATANALNSPTLVQLARTSPYLLRFLAEQMLSSGGSGAPSDQTNR